MSRQTMTEESSIIAVVTAQSVDEAQATIPPVTAYPTDDARYPYAPGYTPTQSTAPAVQMTARVVKIIKGQGMVSPGQTVRVWFFPSGATTPEDQAAAVQGGRRYVVHLSPDQQPAPDAWWSVIGPHSIFKEKTSPAQERSNGERSHGDVFVPIAPNDNVPELTLPTSR